jgi:hypothetical protein
MHTTAQSWPDARKEQFGTRHPEVPDDVDTSNGDVLPQKIISEGLRCRVERELDSFVEVVAKNGRHVVAVKDAGGRTLKHGHLHPPSSPQI